MAIMVAKIIQYIRYAALVFGVARTTLDAKDQYRGNRKKLKRFKLFSKLSFRATRIVYRYGKRKGIAIGMRKGYISGEESERQRILKRLKKLKLSPHTINKVIKP